MKIRSDFVSNSSSSSFIVDKKTNEKYINEYGMPYLESTDKKYNGIVCVEYWGSDGKHTVSGYDNDEEYLETLYDNMCCNMKPKIIEWRNHH